MNLNDGNTTHELQAMDKAVFRVFKHSWDEELLQHWENYPERNLNKERFTEKFTPVWVRPMTINNICNGFRATGIYPFNKNIIPDYAYEPSLK
ncbi:cilia- and flagella-associated protein 47 [Holotrichia oblita]|uniref:Cilia- and flagella-associated protein 47 n=1 Tax=Holotrichia oblita TaxID=644536 RepID=A0ACB9TC26_HOLOL|nr:cilia- and flagella-associated protein 47 [Holotrichia oblita]